MLTRLCATVAVFVLAIACGKASTYDEAVDGDLSDSRQAPTLFGLSLGSNELVATTGDGDIDILTIDVPDGRVLSQLFLRSFTVLDFDNLAFVGLQSGSVFSVDPNIAGAGPLLGWMHFTDNEVGADILPFIGRGFGSMGFTPPLAAGPYSFFLQQTGTAVRYRMDFVLAPLPALAWNLDANGNWSTAANWTGGEPNGVGAAASFLGAISAARTVTIDGPKTVGNLTFDNAQSYTLAGPGPLTINSNDAAMIDVVNGSHTISAPLSIATAKTVTKVGAGTLAISLRSRARLAHRWASSTWPRTRLSLIT
jgi:hypothetical protein